MFACGAHTNIKVESTQIFKSIFFFTCALDVWSAVSKRAYLELIRQIKLGIFVNMSIFFIFFMNMRQYNSNPNNQLQELALK